MTVSWCSSSSIDALTSSWTCTLAIDDSAGPRPTPARVPSAPKLRARAISTAPIVLARAGERSIRLSGELTHSLEVPALISESVGLGALIRVPSTGCSVSLRLGGAGSGIGGRFSNDCRLRRARARSSLARARLAISR